MFQWVRFAANDGNPFCPACGCVKVYTLNETPVRWKCSACRKKFSVTSGTIFHSRKLAIRDYLAVIALFCNGVKGTSALQMSRNMNINPKSAFVLLHKLREAMGAEIAATASCPARLKSMAPMSAKVPHSPREQARPIAADRRREDSKRQVVVVARERRRQCADVDCRPRSRSSPNGPQACRERNDRTCRRKRGLGHPARQLPDDARQSLGRIHRR